MRLSPPPLSGWDKAKNAIFPASFEKVGQATSNKQHGTWQHSNTKYNKGGITPTTTDN